MSEPAIACRAVTRRYGHGPTVLRGVELDLRSGDLAVVRGANGSGKSTLLRIASGVLRPSSGSFRRVGRIGYLPQAGAEPSPRLTILRWWDFMHPPEQQAPLRDMLARLQGPNPEELLAEISGGALSKVLLTAALSGPPGVLLLDEPFAALDGPSRRAARELIAAAAAAGSAVLLSDHTGTDVGGREYLLEEGELRARAVLTDGSWRLRVCDVGGTVRELQVSAADRDRVLAEVLAAGGQVWEVAPLA